MYKPLKVKTFFSVFLISLYEKGLHEDQEIKTAV